MDNERLGAFKRELQESGFEVVPIEGQPHVRVAVPFPQLHAFAELCQVHLDAPWNYVDIQYADQKTTVVVFKERTFTILSNRQNELARQWALARGLPAISF